MGTFFIENHSAFKVLALSVPLELRDINNIQMRPLLSEFISESALSS
jgi:hypothetical protein